MSKKYCYIDAIMSGLKTIESRWYVNRVAPWNKIKAGETVYFKNAGEPVTIKADVASVLQYELLDFAQVDDIYQKYGLAIGNAKENFDTLVTAKLDKNYCILVFLAAPERVTPFTIDKKGFGNASAWLCVDYISKIKHEIC